jgi:precorrin-6B methylase 2
MKKPLYYRKFNYDRALLPNQRLKELEEGIFSIEDAQKSSGLTIGFPGWGLVYYSALATLNTEKKNIILETGTNRGCSTIVLAQALKDSGAEGVVHTVELEPSNVEIAKENVKKAGLESLVIFHTGDSRVVIPKICKEIHEIQVAFLDGCHLKGDVLGEFREIFPKLENRSIVLMDNTYKIAEDHEDSRVFGALPEILEQFGGQIVNLPFVSWYTPGLAMWQKNPFDTGPYPDN